MTAPPLAGLPLAAVVALALAAPYARATPLSARAVDALLRRQGATTTVDGLSRSGRWWGVVARIGGGEARWVALAPRLAAGTDAGLSESLGIALARALPRNPRAVLAAVSLADRDGPAGVDRVCGIPFPEDAVKGIPAYRRRAMRAVRSVRGAPLAEARAACLRALQPG